MLVAVLKHGSMVGHQHTLEGDELGFVRHVEVVVCVQSKQRAGCSISFKDNVIVRVGTVYGVWCIIWRGPGVPNHTAQCPVPGWLRANRTRSRGPLQVDLSGRWTLATQRLNVAFFRHASVII